MEAEFWHDRWATGRIGFHEAAPNGLMVAHLGTLGLAPGARLFLPLCGKTRDIGWLLGRGYRVAGAELSRVAVEQLFDELGLVPEVAPAGAMERFRAGGVEVFVGDVFDLGAEMLGPVDAVYDRAALVALPAAVRGRYGAHVHAVTGGARQLVIAFEYDQGAAEGPPFSVDAAEIGRVYGGLYAARRLARVAVEGGLRPGVAAVETVWLLG